MSPQPGEIVTHEGHEYKVTRLETSENGAVVLVHCVSAFGLDAVLRVRATEPALA